MKLTLFYQKILNGNILGGLETQAKIYSEYNMFLITEYFFANIDAHLHPHTSWMTITMALHLDMGKTN